MLRNHENTPWWDTEMVITKTILTIPFTLLSQCIFAPSTGFWEVSNNSRLRYRYLLPALSISLPVFFWERILFSCCECGAVIGWLNLSNQLRRGIGAPRRFTAAYQDITSQLSDFQTSVFSDTIRYFLLIQLIEKMQDAWNEVKSKGLAIAESLTPVLKTSKFRETVRRCFLWSICYFNKFCSLAKKKRKYTIRI